MRPSVVSASKSGAWSPSLSVISVPFLRLAVAGPERCRGRVVRACANPDPLCGNYFQHSARPKAAARRSLARERALLALRVPAGEAGPAALEMRLRGERGRHRDAR